MVTQNMTLKENPKVPHTLGLAYLEPVYADLDKVLLECEEDFVWLDEILEACKKALVTPDVQLLPKTPSYKKPRRRILRKQDSDIRPDSDADDEEATPPSRATRQTRQKTKKASTQNGRNLRTRKPTSDTLETPRAEVSPTCAANLSKSSALDISADMTPVPQRTVQQPSPATPVQRPVKQSVKQRASAYEKLIEKQSDPSPNNTPVNNKSYSIIETPENNAAKASPDTVKLNKTTSVITPKEKIKEVAAQQQKRRSSRKSLKVLSSKIKRKSSHGHYFARPIEIHPTITSEDVDEPKRKSSRLTSKKTDKNSEVKEDITDSVTDIVTDTTYQSPARITPIPKPRTPKSLRRSPRVDSQEKPTHSITHETITSDSDVTADTKSSDENEDKLNTTYNSKNPCSDRDSGISGILSTQSSAVSLKNLETSEIAISHQSTIMEVSDNDEVFVESMPNRKRPLENSERHMPAPKKRSGVHNLPNLSLAQSYEDLTNTTTSTQDNDTMDSDQYESMDNTDDERPVKCPPSKIVRPIRKPMVGTPNRPTNIISGFVNSLIKRNTPVKPVRTIDQKKKEIMEKDKKNEDRVQKKKDELRLEMQEKKRMREERMRKAEATRLEHEKSLLVKKNENVKKFEERVNFKNQVKADKIRDDVLMKQSLRLQKKKDIDSKMSQQEEERAKKKDQQEEEDRQLKLTNQKRKEAEEAERQKRMAAEAEKARRVKILDAVALKNEQERIEAKRRERDAVIQKEMEKLREMEKARVAKIADEREERQRLKEQHEKAREDLRIAKEKMLQQQKQTQSSTSYTITPDKRLKDNSSNHDYNIQDLHSDDSTDDEDAPRKKIPSWAQGNNLMATLINQEYHPPNLEKIFAVAPDLDLRDLFVRHKPRFNKRTSSAVWDSPLLKPCPTAQFHV